MENMKQHLSAPNEDKEKLWTRDFILISFCSLLLMANLHSFLPTLPLYIEIYGGRSDIAGLPLAAVALGSVLIRPFAGWALDAYGRKAIFLWGLLLLLIPAVVYIGMIPVYALIIMRFIQGLGWGVSNNATNTVAADLVPMSRIGEGMGFFAITITLPMAIAPAAGLWIVENYSFPVMFICSSALIVISLGLVLMIRLSGHNKQQTRPKLILFDKNSLKPALVMLLFTLPYSAAISFLSVYAKEQGLPSSGLFFTAMALATLLTRPITGMFVDRRGARGYQLAVALGGLTICAAMFILANTATIAHIASGGILFGIGFGMGQPTLLALCLMNTTPDKKGSANATYWTAYDLGLAVGSGLWGFVAVAAGFKCMYYLNIIPLIAALLIFFWKTERQGSETYNGN